MGLCQTWPVLEGDQICFVGVFIWEPHYSIRSRFAKYK